MLDPLLTKPAIFDVVGRLLVASVRLSVCLSVRVNR